MPKIIVAIDVGKSGAIVIRYPDGRISQYKMPDTYEGVVDLIDTLNCSKNERGHLYSDDIVFVIEEIPKTTGVNRPAARMFSLFVNYGICVGAVIALEAPYELVKPQTWQKEYKNTDVYQDALRAFVERKKAKGQKVEKYQAHKNALWKVAESLYPDEKVRSYGSDALLIMDWCKTNNY